MPDIFFLDEKLGGASELTERDISCLHELDVKSLVRLRTLPETCERLKKEFNFLHIPFDPCRPGLKMARKVASFLKFLKENKGKCVVYCFQGCDRTCLFAACYLTCEKGMSTVDAINYIRQKRACAFHCCGYQKLAHHLTEYMQHPTIWRWLKCVYHNFINGFC